MRPGVEYMHIEWGRVMIVASHPHDGACLIIQRQETTDPDDDDHVWDTCERSDLTGPLPDRLWPYLGFTSKERAREQSRAFGQQHGFAEVPEGSGRWQYPDGSAVPQDVWDAAWRTTYLPKEAA